jgi:Ala-tRNA(Pro) deacylase
MKTDQYLREKNVPFEHHTHTPVYTAQELAAEEHISGRRVAKVVIVQGEGRGYIMCVLPASRKLDLAKVGMALDCRRCRLADETEMGGLFPDSEVGAEAPFGNLYDMVTLVDSSLAGDVRILFNAGSHRDAIEMSYADYSLLAAPHVADISVEA